MTDLEPGDNPDEAASAERAARRAERQRQRELEEGGGPAAQAQPKQSQQPRKKEPFQPTKRCMACNQMRPKAKFSNSQWFGKKRKGKKRRCSDCVKKGRAVGGGKAQQSITTAPASAGAGAASAAGHDDSDSSDSIPALGELKMGRRKKRKLRFARRGRRK